MEAKIVFLFTLPSPLSLYLFIERRIEGYFYYAIMNKKLKMNKFLNL